MPFYNSYKRKFIQLLSCLDHLLIRVMGLFFPLCPKYNEFRGTDTARKHSLNSTKFEVESQRKKVRKNFIHKA